MRGCELSLGEVALSQFGLRLEPSNLELGPGIEFEMPDFLVGRMSQGELATSYPFGTVPARIDELLPQRARDALRRALVRFDDQIPGFAGPAGLLVGIESRSSGPVRIPRDRGTLVAEGWQNLYPAGEGAGYAGGIMSAALDGAHCAQAWLRGCRGVVGSPG